MSVLILIGSCQLRMHRKEKEWKCILFCIKQGGDLAATNLAALIKSRKRVTHFKKIGDDEDGIKE